MLAREMEDGAQVARLVAGVVAHAVELDREDGALGEQAPQPVGQLDLAAPALPGLLQRAEDVGREQVPPDDGEVRRRVSRGGLLDEIGDPVDAPAESFGGDHSVAADRLARHPLDEQDRAVHLREHRQHPGQRGRVGVDHVVAQHHRERLVADPLAADQHRVAQPPRLVLDRRRQIDAGRQRPQAVEQRRLAAAGKGGVEGRVRAEVVFQHPLAGAADQHDLRQARRDRLFDAVLDDRLVDDGQQLLGQHRRGRQDAGPEARGGEDGLANQGRRGHARRHDSSRGPSASGARPRGGSMGTPLHVRRRMFGGAPRRPAAWRVDGEHPSPRVLAPAIPDKSYLQGIDTL